MPAPSFRRIDRIAERLPSLAVKSLQPGLFRSVGDIESFTPDSSMGSVVLRLVAFFHDILARHITPQRFIPPASARNCSHSH
jgi:hypothetical protein